MAKWLENGGQQFLLLMWKSWLLRKRQYVVTILEILLPLLLSIILVATRSQSSPTTDNLYHGAERVNATFFPTYDPLSTSGLRSLYHRQVALMYCPRSNVSDLLIRRTIDRIDPSFTDVTAFDSEEDIEMQASNISLKYNDYPVLAVVFTNIHSRTIHMPKSLQYKLRYNVDFGTKYRFNTGLRTGPRLDDVYRAANFWSFQMALDHAFIDLSQELRGVEPKDIQVVMQRFPYPSYVDDTEGYTSVDTIPSMIAFGFIILCPVIVKRVVDEKASGVKEMMRMTGLNDWVYWSGAFSNNFLILFLLSAVISCLYTIPFRSGVAVLFHTSGTVFFCVLVVYSAASVLFCLALTTLFNKAIVAVIVTIILWAMSQALVFSFYFIPGQSNSLSLASLGQKLGLCLLPNGALQMACRIMSVLESYGIGSQWINMSSYHVHDVNLSMVIGMMLLSCLIYGIVIWYLDAVWPWQYGIPKPLHFPFMKSYWVGSQPKVLEDDEGDRNMQPEFFEDDPIGYTPGIVMSHLSKTYRNGTHQKTAVDNVSLKIFSSQITALLGHNGAGKTTTMNVLTGLYPPTTGTASINGFDIVRDTRQARRSLGLCPQHNVFYGNLYVEENLRFFAVLKGIRWSRAKEEVAHTLELVELEEKKGELAKRLSGGMKRKLCLGIAIIGGSQVLILDEPTSGMDVEARRTVWDMLHSIRHDRTILLSTHYMEEADVLGDRIAIMARGTIQCCGSPMFLKKKFGTGYHLRVIKDGDCDLAMITAALQRHIPEARLQTVVNKELTYSLSTSTSSHMGEMFEELERRKEELGVESCGVTVTTMEDVFIKVGQVADETYTTLQEESTESSSITSTVNLEEGKILAPVSRAKGVQLLLLQAKGLFLKRFYCYLRYWTLPILQLGIPLLGISVLLSLDSKARSSLFDVDNPPLPLHLPSLYGTSEGFYSHGGGGEAAHFVSGPYSLVLSQAGVSAVEVENLTSRLLSIGERDLVAYRQEYLVGGEAQQLNNITLLLKAWYNGESHHLGAVSLNIMNSALLKYVTGNKKASINIENAPLKMDFYFGYHPLLGELSQVLCSVFIPLSLTFLSSSFVLFPIQERVTKAKLLQRMAGVNGAIFWSVAFLWDYLVHFVCCILILIPFSLLDRHRLFLGHPEALGSVLLLLMSYGWCSIPFSYLASFISHQPTSGFVLITVFNIVTGMVGSLIMLDLQGSMSATKFQGILWIARLLPTFAVTWGFANVYKVASRNTQCDHVTPAEEKYVCPEVQRDSELFQCCKDQCGNSCFEPKHPLTWDPSGCGPDVFCMTIDGLLFFAVLLLLESDLPRRCFCLAQGVLPRKGVAAVVPSLLHSQEDADVSKERQRVEELFNQDNCSQEALTVVDLTKIFGSTCVVDHLTFSVHKEECFGLLGINGAGKTTTFGMLTGDILASDGNAIIDVYTLKDNLQMFQTFIGYCPQFDALIDRLTGREMLFLFARLRGLAEVTIGPTVNQLLTMVHLQQYGDKLTSTYSGGNRRKLSVAMALVGAPPVVFLDEPTTGVDPTARRMIWGALETASKATGAAIILTTHSMEECETLSNRLAIMVNGKFRCLGGTQYLKSKFGQGYTVMAKLRRNQAADTDALQDVRKFIETSFPGAVLKDIHQGMLHYHVMDPFVPCSYLFNTMEKAKSLYRLEDYIVSDTTLEQIFLAFARAQRATNGSGL